MGNSGKDHFIHVPQKISERFAQKGCFARHDLTNLAGFHLRQDREAFDVFIVVRNPVNHGASMLAKLLNRHVVVLLCQQNILPLRSSFTQVSCDNDGRFMAWRNSSPYYSDFPNNGPVYETWQLQPMC